jgi:hypothetical protein
MELEEECVSLRENISYLNHKFDSLTDDIETQIVLISYLTIYSNSQDSKNLIIERLEKKYKLLEKQVEMNNDMNFLQSQIK